ncbi:hypothetical protein U1Q18_048169 [Sarracenia purpurea var. burkii]
MARSEEMSRDGGSTRTMGSSSPVAKELDAVSETLPLFEGQRSPAKLNDEVKEVETMNHPGVSPSPTGQRSPAKISQVFSEALRQDREVTEGDEEDQEEGEIDAASLEEEIDIVELKRRNLVRGKSLAVQIEDEENDDCQEEGEIDLLELKRRNLVRDKALAERELMYIDEIRAQKTGLVDKGKGIANPSNHTPTFVPRTFRGRGGTGPMRGGSRGGGRMLFRGYRQHPPSPEAETRGDYQRT